MNVKYCLCGAKTQELTATFCPSCGNRFDGIVAKTAKPTVKPIKAAVPPDDDTDDDDGEGENITEIPQLESLAYEIIPFKRQGISLKDCIENPTAPLNIPPSAPKKLSKASQKKIIDEFRKEGSSLRSS